MESGYNIKSIEGYDGRYSITDCGKVWSHIRGRWMNCYEQRGNRKGSQKYRVVSLRLGGKSKTFKVHRLVALSFIDNLHNKPTVNHKDGDGLNNNVENLEWATIQEQITHAWSTGLCKAKGEAHRSSKLTEKTALEIIEHYKASVLSIRAIGRMYGVGHQSILKIISGKTWKHLQINLY